MTIRISVTGCSVSGESYICKIQITYIQAYFTSLKDAPTLPSQLAFVISANFSLPQLARFAIFSKALERLQNDANRLHVFLMNYLAYY